MVIRTDEKHKIRYDEQEKNYIIYRIINKSEMAAHLVEANKQLSNCQTTVNTFQNYIDDERVVEPIIEDEPK